MRKRNGFTLVELLITIAVAAILLTIGVPSFQYAMQSSRIATQTNELVTGLQTARGEAVRRNREVTLQPIDGDWLDGFEIVSNGDTLRVFDTFGAGLTLDGMPADVTFRGNGTRDPEAGPLTFGIEPDGDCLGDMRRVVTVTLGGTARTERMGCTQ